MAISELAFLPRRWRQLLLVLMLALTAGLLIVAHQRRRFDNPISTVGPSVLWSFEPPERGAFVASPVVEGDCVYAAAIRDSALAPSGIVYCLDRRSGRVRWQFDDDGSMQQTCSTPCLAEGRLFLGEGMHGNDVCKMYALDAASGRKLWHFVTNGHIESSPVVAEGKLLFGSGDDGLYCLDAATGSPCWHITESRHIDCRPATVGRRVYAGSGVSRLFQKTEVFCLDLAKGSLHWRTPTELPAWGSPVIAGSDVFFGLGTGRWTQSARPPEQPSGALVCAEAASGRIRWIYRVADAVFGRSAVDAEHVFFGSRDGRCYCLERGDGRHRWDANLGSPVVTRPALIDGRLYIVAQAGRVACLDATDGRALWTFDLARQTQTRPQLLSSPVVEIEEDEKGRHHRLYIGAELKNAQRSSAVLYCLSD